MLSITSFKTVTFLKDLRSKIIGYLIGVVHEKQVIVSSILCYPLFSHLVWESMEAKLQSLLSVDVITELHDIWTWEHNTEEIYV